MKKPLIRLRCECGAVDCSAAAYSQMNREQQLAFQRRVIACETCARDREAEGRLVARMIRT